MNSDRRTFIRCSTLATAGLLSSGSASAAGAAEESAEGTGLVRGRVSYGGFPVEDVAVTVDDGPTIDVAEGGTYERELEPGDYTLAVEGDGYVAERKEATVDAGETTAVDFALEREWGPEEGELEVAVVEPGGGSTLETRVTVFGNGEEHSVLAPGGRIPDGDRWTSGFVVPEGWWEVHAEGVDGYGDGYAEVYVGADEEARALVDLFDEARTIPRRGRVSGTVTDDAGEAVPDATVRLRDDRSTRVEVTDDGGEFAADLAHGRYALEVTADGYERLEREVVVRFGRVTERDVTLEAE